MDPFLGMIDLNRKPVLYDGSLMQVGRHKACYSQESRTKTHHLLIDMVFLNALDQKFSLPSRSCCGPTDTWTDLLRYSLMAVIFCSR